jgi:DNA invertase Pin-like site-specific DNA recombinase
MYSEGMRGTTTTATTTRAIAYLRVSTDEQAESGAGLDAQRAVIAAAATARGWELVAEHTDAGVSGKIAPQRRPALAAALEMLDRGDADVLVVAKSDRLARSVVALCDLLDRAEGANWSLVVLDTDVDTSTASGRLVASVIGCVAEWERRVISERTRAALATRKAAGMRLGRPVELPADTRLYIAAMHADGMSLRKIADTLTAEGVPTSRGGQWHASTVRSVLAGLDLDAAAHALRDAQMAYDQAEQAAAMTA